MTRAAGDLRTIRAALAPHGLFVRGIVHFEEQAADAPRLAGGRSARSVVLIGNVGGSIWQPFDLWRQGQGAVDHPLDVWSKATIRPVAEAVCASVWFPSDPPWQPFQQWAMRAEGLAASPLGILIHAQVGLWHGYRAALGLDHPVEADAQPVLASRVCDGCHDKPCLAACPVGAVTADGFDVGICRSHLATDAGRSGCMMSGCVARNACPVGSGHRYGEPQLRFHMAALGV